MEYTSLITYYSSLNNLKKIVMRYSIHINLLHKILNLVLNCKELNYLLQQKTL